MNRLLMKLKERTGTFDTESVSSPAAQNTQKRAGCRAWYLLLLLPYISLLWPSLYSKNEPTLFSFPFFYWYQFLWVPLSAVLTGIVYLTTRRR